MHRYIDIIVQNFILCGTFKPLLQSQGGWYLGVVFQVGKNGLASGQFYVGRHFGRVPAEVPSRSRHDALKRDTMGTGQRRPRICLQYVRFLVIYCDHQWPLAITPLGERHGPRRLTVVVVTVW